MPAYAQILESMSTPRRTKSIGLPRQAYSAEVARECHDALLELYGRLKKFVADNNIEEC